MIRSALLILLISVAARIFAADGGPEPGVKASIPELQSAGQLIQVITASWEAGPARLRRFERQAGSWVHVGEEIRTTVGKAGLAWGIGLHGSFPTGEAPKREGDGKSPAGVFALDELFGAGTAAEAGITRFRYRRMTETFAGVDDPKSRYYNRIVDAKTVRGDWDSAESMVPENGTYRLGCMVRHNWRPFPGYGSCIFIHVWKGRDVPSSGCTAMALPDVEELFRWLDETKRPVLVQLPSAEYDRRKEAWRLP